MRQKLLTNDVHLGVQRVAGTTPATAMQLKEYLLESFRRLIFAHKDKDLVINGDLLDAFLIMLLDALGAYEVIRSWLIETAEIDEMTGLKIGPRAFLGRGNHDWSKDSSKLSTFDFICRLLKAEFGDRVVVVNEPQWIDRGIYMIPHMPNQDLFDLALKDVPALDALDCGLILLHANYKNEFTIESDHSLTVSEKQAIDLVDKGYELVFGHEHQARRMLDGRVIIAGNQWPSSVADCLNNPDNKKYAHVINEDLTLTKIETWDAAEDFAEVEWKDLAEFSGGQRFVRVTGTASAEESAAVVQTIAQFRRDNEGIFVITNAVKVEGVADMGEIQATAENIKAFDVWGFLMEQLDEEERAVVMKLRAEHDLKEAA